MSLQSFAFLYVLVTLLLNAGCAQVSLPASEETAALHLPAFSTAFGPRPPLPAEQQVHTLTPAQQQAFLSYFNDPRLRGIPPYRRLYDYLEDVTREFVYESATYTASEVLQFNSGNCLSLAILTTALARLAGVEIRYQLLDSRPLYELNGTVANKEVHVRSILYDTATPGVNTGAPRQAFYYVDYLPALRGRIIANISDGQYRAMYYLNMAAEATAERRYDAAFWYAQEALKLDPASAQALNIMAILHRRVGDYAKAEAIYLYGIAEAADKLSLLKNYRILLTLQGRHAEAAELLARLDAMHDPSPFNWLNLAREAYIDGDYTEAVRHFDKALALAPYLHEAHLGKAQSYYLMGRTSAARDALRLAIDNVYRASTRSLYQAKLNALAGN